MNYITDDKPIVACSTGLDQNTAIGVIRLSGFPSLDYLQDFFKINISKLEERKATFCNLYFQETLLDEVVITFFKGPKSYNGENILEISAHGNVFNLKRIILSFVESDKFRLAKQGEFTYRALKNEKMSLAQVEGLDALLNASSALMLEQGLELLNGRLYKKYQELHSCFLKMKSAIEMNIDFLDDVGEEVGSRLLNESISHLGSIIGELTTSANISTKSLMSPDIVLVGEPNAGKSSLFNILLNNSRSIVSDIAGTTRDFITEYINIKNNSFRLVDTAGLRETRDQIEAEGIKRSLELLDNGFFKILLVNINELDSFNYKDIQGCVFDLIILTHIDEMKSDIDSKQIISKLPKAYEYYLSNTSKAGSNSGSMGAFLKIGPIEPGELASGSIEPEKNFGPMGAKNNSGSIEPPKSAGPIGAESFNGPIEPVSDDQLKVNILDVITQLIETKFQLLRSSDPILVERHREKINEITDSYEDFSRTINNLDDIAIISSEARIIENKISELIGIVSPDDVLNNIFTNFCIGK